MTKLFRSFWFGFLTLAVFLLHADRLGDYPVHTHAWTQSDRIALSYCYVDNGLDLFHPCTYNLATKEGITAGDLPLIEYLAAIPMFISGIKSPFFLQFLSLVLMFLGFLSIRKMSRLLEINEIGREITSGAFIFSPMLAYYASGSIPSIPSLSLFLIGIYFLLRYFKEDQAKSLWLSIVFLALACLIRKPYILHTAAILMAMIYMHWKKYRSLQRADAYFMLIPGVFLLWNLWSEYLKVEYGTAFLSAIMPPSNFEEFVDGLILIYGKWRFDFFSSIQYAWFMLLFGVHIWQRKGVEPRSKDLRFMQQFILISSFVYLILMLRQFEHHDYYFADAFFPLIFILILNYYTRFRKDSPRIEKLLGGIGLAAVVFWSISSLILIQERSESGFWNRNEVTYKNFLGSAEWLDDHISRDTRVLIPDAYTSNLPLILANRKGFVTVNTNDSSLNELLLNDADHLILQDQYYPTEVLLYKPSIKEEFSFLAGNGKLSLYQRKRSNSSGLEFYGMAQSAQFRSKDLSAILKSSNNEVLEINEGLVFRGSEEFSFHMELSTDRMLLKHTELEPADQELYWVMNSGERTRYYKVKPYAPSLISRSADEQETMELYLWNPKKTDYELQLKSIHYRP